MTSLATFALPRLLEFPKPDQEFHVRNKALLDACTLDVAVIGHAAAARVYVGARAPVAVGIPK